MNLLLLFPFTYFCTTRLREGSLAFHALFEWLAAILVVAVVGSSDQGDDLVQAALSYGAFICVYELGYMANDLHAALREDDGRRRGPQEAAPVWIGAWVGARLGIFLVSTHFMGRWLDPAWWLFFAALGAIFTLHNWLDARELKVSTFVWLAWLRFMAPLIFVVQNDQRMGIGLAAAMGYVAFRQLGYLDGKGLLKMPGRQRPAFRRLFFLIPLAAAAALWPYTEAQGFTILVVYWSVLATVGTLLPAVKAAQ